MKRYSAIIMLAITMFMVAGDVVAQDEDQYFRTPHRFHIFVNGGLGIPANPVDFKDYWNTTLPFSIGAGFPVPNVSWLEFDGVLTRAAFSTNHVKAKQRLNYLGVESVEGGSIKVLMYYGVARFLALPNLRTNPFLEIGVGGFSTSHTNLIIEGAIDNSMEDVSGIHTSIAGGLRYALNEGWSAYFKYQYVNNINDEFKPGDLILPIGADPASVEGGNMQYGALLVGLIIRL